MRTQLERVRRYVIVDDDGDISHSNLLDRVVSTASGHQVAEERMDRQLYLEDRKRKLADQREKCSDPRGLILRYTRIYIDGYLEGETDIEIKRMITLGGGHVMFVISLCTVEIKAQVGSTGRPSLDVHTSSHLVV